MISAYKRVIKSEKEIKAICEAHINERTDEIVHNAAYQSLATAFYILTRDFGFGKQRLKKLKDAIEDEFSLMDIGILGKDYNADNCCKYLKENYDIDFGESKFSKQEG